MTKFFVYFPETDDEIVRTNTNLINIFSSTVNFIKNKSSVFYDEQNVETYLQKSQILGLYLSNPKEQIRIILHKIGAISLNNQKIKQGECTYIIWNFDEIPQIKIAQNLIAEIAERHYQFPIEKHLLLNFQNSINACREQILVFKDAKHIKALPKEFVKIDFITDVSELEIWLKTNDKQSFSLLDHNRFKRTSFPPQQGKPVFEEVSTGFFWYLDNFHKNEYEVFNAQHEHIGVANMNGEVDYSRKVKGRTF